MNEQARAAWRARVQKATIAVAALAALFLIIAAAVNMWGVHRQLKQVQAQRTAVHPMVAATLIGRSTVEDAYRRLAALADAQRAAPHWAPVLADLSELLPDDAFLTAFRTRGDSLTVDGMAAHAASVFDAIHDSHLLSNVRAPAPVRAEAPEGGNPLERFTIAATMRSSVSPPEPPAKTLPEAGGCAMSPRELSAKDRRALKFGAMALPVLLLALAIRPYRAALADAQDRLATERDALSRERGAVLTAQRNPALQQMTDSVLHVMEPRLFEGTDDVIASSGLAAYVGDVARARHVWVQDAATRPTTSTTAGVRTLHVEIRGESDLRGILSFLDALEHGDKLVRIERLDVSRGLSGPGNEQAETLTISATIAGYAMGNLNVPPPPGAHIAPAANVAKP